MCSCVWYSLQFNFLSTLWTLYAVLQRKVLFFLACGWQRWSWGQLSSGPDCSPLSLSLVQLLLPDDGAGVWNLLRLRNTRAGHCYFGWTWLLYTRMGKTWLMIKNETIRISATQAVQGTLMYRCEEDYLGGCRLHLAFLLLVLLVGSRVHHQLFAPPEDRQTRLFVTCVHAHPTLSKPSTETSRQRTH